MALGSRYWIPSFPVSISLDNSTHSLSPVFLKQICVLFILRPWLLVIQLWCSHYVAAWYVSTYFIRYCIPLVHDCSIFSLSTYEYEVKRDFILENHFKTYCTTFLACFSSTSLPVAPWKFSHLSLHHYDPKSTNTSIVLPTYTALLRCFLCWVRGLSE